MRIAIAWKSSLAIKKLKIRREKKQEGKEAAWQWAPHAQTTGIWDGTAVVLEGFCCLGAFLMNKLHPPEWSLPFPSHCLCTVICFSLIPSHCCIWDSAYWCEKKKKKPSHVIDKSRDNCRGQGTAETREQRTEFQPAPAPSSLPPALQESSTAWPRMVNWADFPPGSGWGEEGRKQFNCISSLSDLSHFNLCSL